MSASKRESKANPWYGIEEDLVRGLYLGLLGREPDVPGMMYWITRVQAGDSIDGIAHEILHGDECRQRKDKGLFKQPYQALCHRVAEWASVALSARPLICADVSVIKLQYENQFYDQLNAFKIPHRIMAYGPSDHLPHEVGGKLTLSADFICDGSVRDFHLNEPDYTSSFLPFHSWVKERVVNDRHLSTMKVDSVQTHTVDHAMRDIAHVDLLKINIHGLELLTLQNAISILQRTDIVHCNVSFIDMYEGQSNFNEVEQYLKKQGFEFIDFYEQRHYSFAATPFSWSRDLLGQVGAVFFRRLQSEAAVDGIISQSLLALMVYQKPSMAAWLAKHLEPDHPWATLFSAYT